MNPAVDRQSEVSTDIRWLKVYIAIAFGKVRFPIEKKQDVEDVLNFPNAGDLRKVRPFIRSTEDAFRAMREPLKWIGDFWDEVYQRTACVDSSKKTDLMFPEEKRVKQEDMVTLCLRIVEGFVSTTTPTGSNGICPTSGGSGHK